MVKARPLVLAYGMPKWMRALLIVLFLLLLCLLMLLFARCHVEKTPLARTPPVAVPTAALAVSPGSTPTAAPASADDVLTAATLTAPASVTAGAVFSVQWKGPNNPEDYVTVVSVDAPESGYGDYKLTKLGSSLELTAPVEPGPRELRYIAGRAKKVLGRAPLTVLPTAATLAAPDQAGLGTTITVAWTGPNNPDDYLTIVPREAPDGQYGGYALTSKGSPLVLTVPVDAGEAEIRYMTGKEHKVLGRRALTITMPEMMLSAPTEVPAGSLFAVTWRGPNNPGDYITVVPKAAPDGQYRNYTLTQKGSPLKLLALIEAGPAELRYMTETKGRVLAKRSITLLPLVVTLSAATEATANSTLVVTWTGPNYEGDYVTIVAASAPDNVYAGYQVTAKGSPIRIATPKQSGPAEIRYISGQGGRVLGRRAVAITPAATK